jgi:hypothetical protein
MACRLYREFVEAILDVGFLGTGSAPGALSATPTVTAIGLDSGYTFASTHTYASLTAAMKTTAKVDYDGEDSADAVFTDGYLWLANGTKTFSGADDAARSIAVYVDHGGWQLLVCHFDTFDGYPLSIVNGETATLEWSQLLPGLFQSVALDDSGVIYPRFMEQAIGALVGGSARTTLPASATVSVNLLTVDARLLYEDEFLSDVNDLWWAGGEAEAVDLTTVATATNGDDAYVDADNATLTSMTGSTAEKVLVYLDSGSAATSLLALQFDLPNPVTLNGSDITLEWDGSDSRILRLGAG